MVFDLVKFVSRMREGETRLGEYSHQLEGIEVSQQQESLSGHH